MLGYSRGAVLLPNASPGFYGSKPTENALLRSSNTNFLCARECTELKARCSCFAGDGCALSETPNHVLSWSPLVLQPVPKDCRDKAGWTATLRGSGQLPVQES